MLRKEIDKLIEIQWQISILYEKLKNAKDENERKQIVSYITLAKEVEDNYVRNLHIDKIKFYKILRMINVDNTLNLIYDLQKRNGRGCLVDMDNCFDAYFYLWFGQKKDKKLEKPDLTSLLASAKSYPLIRRLFYKILESYYKNIQNPPLGLDANIIELRNYLIQNGKKGFLLDPMENTLALLYLDAYTELEINFLREIEKENIKEEKTKALLSELKRHISFVNPNLESYLLLSSFDVHLIPTNLECKYKKQNKNIYKSIREYCAKEDIKNVLYDYEISIVPLKERYNLFYRLYIKSRLPYLKDETLNYFTILIHTEIPKIKATESLWEVWEEEIQKRMEKRQKTYKNH